MFQLTIPAMEYYDEVNNLFVKTKKQKLQLEHSLVSLSKWESKWEKPFLHTDKKTLNETMDYIRCMTITQNVDPSVYGAITLEQQEQINKYLEAPMTATWFKENKNAKKTKEIVTAEIIYYWMVSLNIPFECQKWHLNRLLTLVRVCTLKNAPPDKMSRRDILSNNRAINEARKQQLKTNG